MFRSHTVRVVALIAVCALGCSHQGPPDRSLDPEQAKELLVTVLDGWKAGRPHAEPLESEPSLRVADEDWLVGRRLIDYRLLPGESVVGDRLSCPVGLSMETPEGRRMSAQVVYLISTAPELSVIRVD
ncbi:hypothetical protein AB1L88_20310 [Tautonia sp. JC769]|uniref:hypothetical protein n=1 Tax=Tautonia sp. JC769 TaxID=3232135 RepID=UPI0034576127